LEDVRGVAGHEFAGDIAATGPGAGTARTGKRVMGTTQGAFAQYGPQITRAESAGLSLVADEPAA
jgi:NADPH:quinone reductase-like Zn-dependent oxidoreductase